MKTHSNKSWINPRRANCSSSLLWTCVVLYHMAPDVFLIKRNVSCNSLTFLSWFIHRLIGLNKTRQSLCCDGDRSWVIERQTTAEALYDEVVERLGDVNGHLPIMQHWALSWTLPFIPLSDRHTLAYLKKLLSVQWNSSTRSSLHCLPMSCRLPLPLILKIQIALSLKKLQSCGLVFRWAVSA